VVVELLKKAGVKVRGANKINNTEDDEASEKKTAKKKSATKKAGKKSASKKTSAIQRTGRTTGGAALGATRKSRASRQSKKKSEAARGGCKSDASCETGLPDAEEPNGDPFEVARKKMKGSVPAIVDKMVKEAMGGSCTHAKTVLEMTGARQMFDEEARPGRTSDPWAKRVLKKMEEAEVEDRRRAAPETAVELP